MAHDRKRALLNVLKKLLLIFDAGGLRREKPLLGGEFGAGSSRDDGKCSRDINNMWLIVCAAVSLVDCDSTECETLMVKIWHWAPLTWNFRDFRGLTRLILKLLSFFFFTVTIEEISDCGKRRLVLDQLFCYLCRMNYNPVRFNHPGGCWAENWPGEPRGSFMAVGYYTAAPVWWGPQVTL